MRKEKTVWVREYKKTGRFVWGHGAYAIKKYLYPYGKTRYFTRYAVSVSPMRKSWYRSFFNFQEAKKFANLKYRNKE